MTDWISHRILNPIIYVTMVQKSEKTIKKQSGSLIIRCATKLDEKNYLKEQKLL